MSQNGDAEKTWAGQEISPALDVLLKRVNELHDFGSAMGVLNWDREVNTPPKGIQMRITQMVSLGAHLHKLATSDEVGSLISDAENAIEPGAHPEADALLRVLRRDYDRQRVIGADLQRRVSETSGRAHSVWVEARQNDDFESFQPWLEKVVELGREIAEKIGYEDEPYDALLDRFEQGAKTAWVEDLFGKSRDALVPLRKAIDESGRSIDDSILERHYPVDAQKAFAPYMAKAVGYDLERGHIGTAVHPFATSFGRDDCRITSRWYPNFINASVFGTLHECGHAMYEQGTDPRFERTPLARGASSGIHESQSRMIENVVGRGIGFWRAHYPRLVETFPESLEGVTVEDFHAAINSVKPSLIRVEADELTYNLHIILRFELERALVRGDLAVKDLPAAWSEGLLSLVGVAPTTDREGVLQDVHWTRPSFGYFPTYALGNLYAAQFLEAAVASDPAIGSALEDGRPGPLQEWLGKNVHIFGRSKTPDQIVMDATGSPLGHGAFTRYATTKFSDVYGLSGV